MMSTISEASGDAAVTTALIHASISTSLLRATTIYQYQSPSGHHPDGQSAPLLETKTYFRTLTLMHDAGSLRVAGENRAKRCRLAPREDALWIPIRVS
jgi:hypothetical protein